MQPTRACDIQLAAVSKIANARAAPVQTKNPAMRRGPLLRSTTGSQAEVQIELDRVRGHTHLGDFLHLQVDVAIDEIVGEYATGL